MVDDAAVVRQYLASDPGVVAVLGNRIWAQFDEPPNDGPNKYRPSHGAGLVFKSAGGGLEAGGTILRTRWQLKFYGPSPAARRDAYSAVTAILHDTRGRGGILSSSLESGPIPLVEPDLNWEFLLAFFETRMKSRLPEPA